MKKCPLVPLTAFILLGATLGLFECDSADRLPPSPADQGCPRLLVDSSIIPAPGLTGIVLTPGPELIFQIDTRRSSHRGLFWDDFRSRFRDANVKIVVEINTSGDVVRWVQADDGGQPAAFDMVWDAVQTWRYEGGCLYGELCFIFNQASKRIMIDDSRLTRVPGYEDCMIRRGKLHGVFRRSPQHQYYPSRGRCD